MTAGPREADLRAVAGDGRWHYRRSLASRVTLLTTIAVGVSVAFVALGAFVTVRMQLQSTLDDSLLERATAAADGRLLSRTTNNPIPSGVLGAADVRIIFLAVGERAVSADSGPTLDLGAPELAVLTGQADHSVRTVEADGTHWRVATVPNGVGRALVIAQSLASQERVLSHLGLVMLLFGLAGVIAAAAAGWGVARNGLRPVRRLTHAVEGIARTEDLTPLPVEGDDEIARLATAFNHMLTALAASRDRQRQLVADAGHELRTPLTSLRTNIDLLAQADAAGGLPADAKAELLSDLRGQVEELTTLVGDLVELARDEPLTHAIETVDLADIVERALMRVRRRAPGLTFDVATTSWWVIGEPGSLERAITNLLDNAVKWSPPGSTVSVRLSNGVVCIDDEGPGISEQDLPHIFERFYRSPESRAMPGSGLGLSIAQQVAARHAGNVRAEAAPSGGARLLLSLPGNPTPPPAPPPAGPHPSGSGAGAPVTADA